MSLRSEVKNLRWLGATTDSLTYGKLEGYCKAPDGLVLQKVEEMSQFTGIKGDTRKPTFNLHVVNVCDSQTKDKKNPDEFRLSMDLQKILPAKDRMVLLTLSFNCELVCRANIPNLPEKVSRSALIKYLSLQPKSYVLGGLKIDSVGVLLNWFTAVAVFDVCSGMPFF